jgi:hypothetical protein
MAALRAKATEEVRRKLARGKSTTNRKGVELNFEEKWTGERKRRQASSRRASPGEKFHPPGGAGVTMDEITGDRP